ncbi:MAG TPA: hypothetical protein VFQ52_10595 [Rhizomicrobium sp.]|nr:hypothetical protein [Rhizomicrobium sp.]
MQVSATLIAAQQAAREARARLQVPQQAPQASFAAALDKTAGVKEGFSALPLKQTAAPAQAAPTAPANAPSRMGQHVNILV